MKLESFEKGRWVARSGTALPVYDAVDRTVVAEIGEGALDYEGLLRFAREVGGPKLRAMPMHARAHMLKGLASALNAIKNELYVLSRHAGATANDAWLDVDGGIGTLVVYANKALKEWANETLHFSGSPERTSRNGTFLGRHLWVPRRGVALHINAFNLPVWGMLEKLAPAWLAGMPAVVKPASVSAYLAVRAAKAMLDSGHLPEGALQLIVGSVGDSFEHLDGQDVVAFSGTGPTGRALKGHPRVIDRSVRFNLASESLNFAMLAPDVAPGTPDFDLFVQEVVRELRVKAGQRATAIRRVLVPKERLGEVTEALRAALGELVVGDPALEGVDLGPLVSLEHREQVQRAIAKLRASTEVVFGDGPPEPRAGDPERGAFLSPTLLRCAEPFASEEVHEVEAFGPVVTLMPYGDLGEGSELIRRGRGALVGTVVTTLAPIARQLVLETASHHGRILILNRECAAESTGHGTALPHLLHGGPGRAGDGTELGGLRGIELYAQRTALQGGPRTLSGIATWNDGE